MIDTNQPILTAYYTALNGNVTVTLPVLGSTVIPVYSFVPDDVDYPYIVFSDQSDSGGDVETRTKDNQGASEHLFTIQVVTAFRTSEDNASYKVAQDIADEVLQIVLTSTPLTFTGLENVTASLESYETETERNETHLLITKTIVIRHLLSQS
jgi:hypothetical protein